MLGQEISRHYFLYKQAEKQEVQCVTAGALWNDASNLVTLTKRVASGVFMEELLSVKRPDGTLTLYQYTTNSTSKTTAVFTGQPDGTGTNVIAGTKTVTVVGLAGQMISNQVFDIASNAMTDQQLYSNYDAQLELGSSSQSLVRKVIEPGAHAVHFALDCLTNVGR